MGEYYLQAWCSGSSISGSKVLVVNAPMFPGPAWGIRRENTPPLEGCLRLSHPKAGFKCFLAKQGAREY